ncbi:hypothetical protein CORC01_09015 [Colletotrichum orchidophilum]|uniref:Uncharacterized protein n=1 Tax=Colletotrichum orchidophilum TaxID=1209926 RepID=A0A1G4B2W3_9PEZI|nr:uncharacterized protein CORC01_09015 [Colletotrichum orchidophilum]OHE95731.1 hypothetical protein CORC01_09015 [Colletotrichum orchidophilum]
MRQRPPKAPPVLDVPNIEEDAPERKRVLNVLAQRRYREFHRLADLLSSPLHCTAHGPGGAPLSHLDGIEADSEAGERKRQDRLAREKGRADGPERSVSETCADNGSLAAAAGAAPPVPDAIDPIEQIADRRPPVNSERDGATVEFNLDASTAWHADLSDDNSISELLYGANPPIFDHNPDGETATEVLPSPPSTIDPASLMDCASLSSSEFPDSYLLPLSDLKLLTGLLRVATRLGSESVMWDPAATSPFNLGAGTPVEQLPEMWKPTAAQVLVPHHPIMDFLPWPGVRDRIINLFSLPDGARPPAARGQLGLVNFAYDLEDSSEGARIWGGDPYDASCWEVGQVLFERWWFLFDRSVIAQSNKWRSLRGAEALQMRPGSVVDLTDAV